MTPECIVLAPKSGRPPKKPRTLTLNGKTYVSLGHAAKLAGLAHSAMYRWINREQQLGTPLDLLIDEVAHHRFISEECLNALMKNRFHPANPMRPRAGALRLNSGITP